MYLDHTRAGRLRHKGRPELPCAAGNHVVRIRQWWYRSNRIQVAVSEGQSITLTADIPRDANLMRRMALFLSTPSKALCLKDAREGPL